MWSERHAAFLLEQSPNAILGLSLEGAVLFMNAAAHASFGLSSDTAGRTLESLLDASAHEPARNALLRAQTVGSAGLVGTVTRGDSQLRIEIALHAVEGPDGTFIAAAARTAEPMSSRDLDESSIHALLEAAPDAIVIVDRAGKIVLANGQTEKLFGHSRDELIGKPVETLIPLRYNARHVEHRTGFVAQPRVRTMGANLELYALRKDGTEFPVEVSLSPLSTERGELVWSAIRDVTDRKLLELRTLEANRLKSEFLANMSHELRTPLNAIIGFTELMHSGKVGALSPQHKEYLGDILTSSRHLLQLINDVLDLAKVESGKMEFRPEEVDIRRLVQEVRDVLRGLAATKRLRLEQHVDEDLSKVVVDAARVKQILYNYLSNGIKFTPAGGKVIIRALSQADDLFRIEVEDTGIGIAPEAIAKLFVEFQQLDASTAKKYQGTGLGLALTKRIAEAHGGRVEVRSKVGEGSVFAVVLPRHAATDTQEG